MCPCGATCAAVAPAGFLSRHRRTVQPEPGGHRCFGARSQLSSSLESAVRRVWIVCVFVVQLRTVVKGGDTRGVSFLIHLHILSQWRRLSDNVCLFGSSRFNFRAFRISGLHGSKTPLQHFLFLFIHAEMFALLLSLNTFNDCHGIVHGYPISWHFHYSFYYCSK